MRIVATALLAIGVLGLVPSAIGAGPKPKRPALGAPRILYSSDWSGTDQVYAVDPSGRLPIAQLTFGQPPSCGGNVFIVACGFADPVPSPDGRWLLYRDVTDRGRVAGGLWIARADGGAPRLLARSASSPAWSPDSRLIAFNDTVVDVNGRRVAGIGTREGQVRRPAAVASTRLNFCAFGGPAWSPDGRSLAYPVCTSATPGRLGRFKVVSIVGHQLAWSPDGRRIAYVDHGNIGLASPSGIPVRAIGKGDEPAWSPDGKSLAFRSTDGLRVLSLSTGKSRLLTTDTRATETGLGPTYLPLGLVWAPDGRSLAYVPGDFDPCCGLQIWSGGVRVVDLTGHARTVVSVDTKYGGRMVSLAWTRPPAALRYRQPLPAPSTRVAKDGILADGPVEYLAADGDRVAYATACNTVSTWTPKQVTSTLVTGSPTMCMDGYGPGFHEDVALGDNSVAWVEACCNNTKTWNLYEQTFDTPPQTFKLGGGHGDADIAGPALGGGSHFDSPAAAGSLLVFSSWQSAWNPDTSHYQVIWESIVRAGPAGCPCSTLRTDPGPLIIDDVDSGHIAAHGNNGTVILDDTGSQLSFIPDKPMAAVLSGGNLLVLLQGELLDYDWASGTLVHRWPLPDVAAGPDCPFGIDFGCGGPGHNEQPLRLQDAAHGLVTYVLDDQVHLLRLADGKDATIAAGSHARFMEAGLVYTHGSRLHLVPYDQLPLY